MATLLIKKADFNHLTNMAGRIRKDDEREALSLGYMLAEQALEKAFEISIRAWALVDREGYTMAMWGVYAGSMMGRLGHPWLVTTNLVEQHKVEFARRSRVVLSEMLRTYPVLDNYVDSRYVRCIRWLKWLGFEVYQPDVFTSDGTPFRRFVMGD